MVHSASFLLKVECNKTDYCGTISYQPEQLLLGFQVMMRSFFFMGICILWIYAVGIHEETYSSCVHEEADDAPASHMKSASETQKTLRRRGGYAASTDVELGPYSKKGQARRDADESSLWTTVNIHPFTPCQLRFSVLLFLDGWFFGLSAGIMLLIAADRLQHVACVTCVQGSTSSGYGFYSYLLQTRQLPPGSRHAGGEKMDQAEEDSSESEDDSDDSDVPSKYEPAQQSSSMNAAASLDPAPDADMLALFRRAQQAAAASTSTATLMSPSLLQQQDMDMPGNNRRNNTFGERLGEMI